MKELFLHELRNNLFSGKFIVAFSVMLIAFLISLGMMSQEFQSRMDNFNASMSLSGKDLFWNKFFFYWPEGGRPNSSDTITFPMGKVKKPEPFLYFARGMDEDMRQSVEFISTFPIVQLTVRPEQEPNLLKLLFTAPDMLFILKVLISLLAVLFAYNMISEERERGTLKLLLTCGASRSSIFSGKYLGGLFSMWLAFSTAFLVYLLALSFVSSIGFQGEVPIRILLIYLTSLLHIAVFFSMGVAVSVFVRHSAPALILSLFFWLLFVFILPGMSSLMAQQFVPVDSSQKVARMKLEKAQQMEQDYASQHPEDTNISNTAGYGIRHDAIRGQINSELQKIDDEHARSKAIQAALTTNLARVSPVGSLTYLYSALCRHGLQDRELYQQDLLRIRNKIDSDITALLQQEDFIMKWIMAGWEIPQDIKTDVMPMMDFARDAKFTKMELGNTLAATWLDFILLSVFALVSVALSFTRFLYYDPR